MNTKMYNHAKKIFPICRSITGEGVRETLNIINEFLDEDGIKIEENMSNEEKYANIF